MSNQASEDELGTFMEQLGFFWDSYQSNWRNDGRKQFSRDYDDLISMELAKQLLAHIRTEKLKLLAEVRERVIDTCIKYIRSGQVGGSFSEGCDCEKCDKYEKKVRDDLAQLTQNPKSEEAEL
jgi:hypothetical protein